jgi:hypothetical protein
MPLLYHSRPLFHASQQMHDYKIHHHHLASVCRLACWFEFTTARETAE